MKSITSRQITANPTLEELATYTPIVHRVVARLMPRLPPNVLRDDLIAAGTFGLVDALRRSTERGPLFERYVRIRVRGAVIDELRAQDWLTRRARTKAAEAGGERSAAATTIVGFDDLPGARNDFVDETAATPHEQMEWHMDRLALVRAVGTLPRREADVVTWHYFEGVPFKVIALRLGVSEPRVSQLHARAVGLLRARVW
jgi:RNA polymerase sigma factor for flagellar operon FliA